ncbi:PREDICTED: uncharacterized protein LOC107350707 [Acropora digitifera]|uniref:uncharacterized protein LOC107350707 n=1 Tax=Acropora digitifera TaxID=70779 RepID=UPI00077A44DE|nr:PREDICTED: uncharacterized protein LOC107350707 [Acropora digitifera]
MQSVYLNFTLQKIKRKGPSRPRVNSTERRQRHNAGILERVDHGTLDQGASLLTSNRLSSAMDSHSRIKESRGKRPLDPLVIITPVRKRQNRDIPAESSDESVSFKPGTVSEDDVILIADELGPLWKKIGRVLKVPKAVINQIEADKSEVSDKCYTVLTKWQELFPYDATYHRLALALKHQTVGRVDLAAKYCEL